MEIVRDKKRVPRANNYYILQKDGQGRHGAQSISLQDGQALRPEEGQGPRTCLGDDQGQPGQDSAQVRVLSAQRPTEALDHAVHDEPHEQGVPGQALGLHPHAQVCHHGVCQEEERFQDGPG